MSSGPTLSRFTPSVMGRDLLERLFVVRDRLLDEIVRRIEAAATSQERNHTLLVGPRGAGKTHLVALVAHRARDLMAEGREVQLAWLPEDPWTLVTYRHLLTQIVSRLEPPFEGVAPRRPEELEALLARRAEQHGPAVVIVENLDQILDAIGNDGQQRLRHLLQSDRSLLLVATSTTLDRSLSHQASPFYGFFTTSRLEPFDVDEAAAMLTAIAVERSDDELVDYLASDEGRARLRTIEHLAGGQPRMWAALASALTVDGLDDLVDLLLTRFDDLTPYYQEQLARLSGQQRLVVAELAEVDRPITVKELAERLEIDQRSLGKTVSDLVERRWMAETTSPVTAMLDRRRTYYELAEPMARLSFQIKDNRGEPLRVIVDFLKHWFDPEDLNGEGTAELAVSVSKSVSTYIDAAAAAQRADPVVAVIRRLTDLPEVGSPSLTILGEVDDALRSLERGEAECFLALPSALRRALEGRLRDFGPLVGRLVVHAAAANAAPQAIWAGALVWMERAESLVAKGAPASMGQAQLARWQAKAGFADVARATLGATDDPATWVEAQTIVEAYFELSGAMLEVGDVRAAIDMFERALGIVTAWPKLSEPLGGLHSTMRDLRRGLDALEKTLMVAGVPALRMHHGSWAARRWASRLLVAQGRHSEAAALVDQLVEEGGRLWGSTDPRTKEAIQAQCALRR